MAVEDLCDEDGIAEKGTQDTRWVARKVNTAES